METDGRQYQAMTPREKALHAIEAWQGLYEREKQRAQRAEQMLWDVDSVARFLGHEHGAPDCIDNDGVPYQSEQLHRLLIQVDALEGKNND